MHTALNVGTLAVCKCYKVKILSTERWVFRLCDKKLIKNFNVKV